MTEQEKVIQVYQDVLNGNRCRFPNYFFVGERGKKYLAYITRFLIEDYLGIRLEEIPSRVSAEILWDHRLRPPAMTHGWNFTQVIQNAYPGRFDPWAFKQVSHGYWKRDEGQQRALDAIRFVIEEKCRIPHNEIPHRITNHFFKQHGLRGVFNRLGQSPYRIIDMIYPGQFKPWEFHTVPMNFWRDPDHVKQAMDWLLFERIGFSSYHEAVKKLTLRYFFQYRCTGLLRRAFDGKLQKVKEWILEQQTGI
ncbi:hypothetical protein [Alicyclobacillus fastidiosus]|uniref:Uncharacterized protein n=2 Tax=Alicyclobacillus fastidiosus TaxID=392011 RepID=A0ABY6ZSK3_9BACL|nr:hypothetical protein [Alicyclobacillus fastidiosus]WAH44930.1 hypothetical protein NZD89_28210 [Alicyclobacillus fastidiosus]WEH10053.1 hypothetical protein PYS47_01830 [Alicyclobacillus fastidiosus]GMA65583.1 hypothetical protein GCM10025859_60230 [Alicyclobacillus fastidiosus]GMA65698.1 hypothetical protein GCM10025859_61380 [Alicyclobacillus fastidiosus]